MTARLALLLAALLMFVAVGLGAFGAHALKSRLAPEMQGIWQTAVQYHAWHALGLFAVGLLIAQLPEKHALGWAGWLLLTGIVLFSGSLYALALTGNKAFGAITPVGGVAFLAGWLAVAWTFWRG
jgi:uncharacterized membrane protein YgdD (TMEM256/DUF423 family)